MRKAILIPSLHSRNSGQGFRPDIQGLRALAVLSVLLYHSHVPTVTGGFVGVDIFFVISGYLITGHIVQGLTNNRFNFRDFYSRRVRRILPASFVVLAVSLAAAWILLPPLELNRVSRDAAWTAIYLPNVLFAREGTNYLASPEPSLFQHYWSLGIEEQFYLLCPLIIWAVYRVSSRRMLAVLWTVATLVALSFAGSGLFTHDYQPQAFFLLPTRAWELGTGGLVALILFRFPNFSLGAWRTAAGVLGLAAIIAPMFLFDNTTPFPSYNAALPVLGTALVILAGPYEGLLGSVLQNRAALWVGAISYSLYLVHWPLLIIPEAMNSWAAPLPLWQSAGLAALAIPLAWLSYRWVETPLRRPRKKSKTNFWLPLIAAVGVAVLAASISVVGMRAIPTMQLDVGKPAPDFELSKSPVAPPYIGNNLSVRLQDAPSEMSVPSGAGCDLSSISSDPPPGCTYGNNTGAPHVALIGDSHAAQWAPAFEQLAEDGRMFLTAHTKSACSLHTRNADLESTVCVDWKAQVLEWVTTEKPDILVITHSVLSQSQDYEPGIRELLAKLPEESKVVLLADTPRFPGDPISCLSANLSSPERCSAQRAAAEHSEYNKIDMRMEEEFDVTRIDLNEYLCADTCPVVQGNMLVFKDQQHLSKTFVKSATPALEEALRPTLAAVQH